VPTSPDGQLPALHILPVGAGDHVDNLSARLGGYPDVHVLLPVDNAHYAWGDIREGMVNTILVDPFSMCGGVEEASYFIFRVRYEFPSIVFVLFTRDTDWDERHDELYNVDRGRVVYLLPEEFDAYDAEQTRLAHYYRLITSADERLFAARIEKVVHDCQAWHQRRLDEWPGRHRYQYDVALSFAGEDRSYAERLANYLSVQGVRVFYDDFEKASLWGKNLYEHLYEIYSNKSRYCIMLISEAYVNKMWTVHERRSAQERALQSREQEYILPVRLDKVALPGMPSTVAYLDGKYGPEEVSRVFLRKLGEIMRHGDRQRPPLHL
jgi:hypothetical protein